jgi:hypothetical protein
MLPVILGVAGAGLVGYGLKKTGIVSFGAEDDTHNTIFNNTLQTEKDPKKIAALGNAFIAAGKKDQGNVLLKRAVVGTLPAAAKKARREVTQKAFSSFNPVAVDAVAKAFESQGCVGHAQSLRQYAGALRQIKAQTGK